MGNRYKNPDERDSSGFFVKGDAGAGRSTTILEVELIGKLTKAYDRLATYE